MSRKLRMVIEVIDDGGEHDYDDIIDGLMSIGAEIVDEEDIP